MGLPAGSWASYPDPCTKVKCGDGCCSWDTAEGTTQSKYWEASLGDQAGMGQDKTSSLSLF